MTADQPDIIETADAFIVNGLTIPKMKRGQMNLYDPALIKAVGADLFFQLIAPAEPVPIPDLGFSQAEWDDMEAQLRDDR